MIALSIVELVRSCRITTLRDAIVSSFANALPEVEVKGHPGKLDFADVVAKDMFRCPGLAVTTARAHPADRLSGANDLDVDVTIYVIAEDMMLGSPGRLAKRDEVAWALVSAVMDMAADPAISRWALADIGYPEHIEGKPLFTAITYERGTVYFAVTWRQRLYAATSPLWQATRDDLPPPGFSLPGTRVGGQS